MAGDTTIKVDVDTRDAQTQLKNLQGKFESLKTAILGVGFTAALAAANQYANAVKDISVTADISVKSVIALGKAFQVNGGDADGAQAAILKFADSVGQAVAGSDAAQKSFKDIGISLKDIQTLSQEDLLAKSILGISKLESAAQRVRVQTDLFGRSAKGVSFPGVQGDFAAAQASAAGYQSAIQAGSDASESLNKNLGNLKQALLNVAEPLNKIVAASETTVKQFESLIKIFLAAGSSLLLFGSIIPRISMGFAGLVAGLGGFSIVTALVTGFQNLLNVFKYLGAAVGLATSSVTGFAALALAVRMVLTGLLRFAGVAGIIYTIVEAVDFLLKKLLDFSIVDWVIDKFNKLKDAAMKAFGVADSVGGGRGNGMAELAQRAKDAAEEAAKLKKQQEEAAAKAKEFAERQKKLSAEIRKVGDELAYQNDKQLEALALETRLVGKDENSIEMARGLADIYRKQDDTLKGLIETRKQWAMGTEEQKGSVGIIDKEIARVKALTAEQAKNFEDYTNRLQGVKMIEEDRKRTIENITHALEEQQKRQEALANVQLSIIGQKQDIEFQKSLKGLSNYQKEVANIQEATRKTALEAARSYAASFEDTGDGLTPERLAELGRGLDAIATGYRDIAMAQIEALGSSDELIRGLTEAWDEYKAKALDTAGQIKSSFENFTSGLEDAFVSFVQNGKLSFKSLANSILADLARIAFKKAVLGMAGIFGFAAGGSVMGGTPIMVGERGPELFVPSSAGKIVPNNVLNGSAAGQGSVNGGGQTTVNYNIQAVDASSFRSMVARDPSFIYAVTEQGRRSQPSRSR